MADIPSVLATIRRNRIASALIAFEAALACAVFCNVVFLVARRVERINLPSGVAERELVHVQVAARPGSAADGAQAATLGDLAALSGIAGVVSATVSNQLPFTWSEWTKGIMLRPDQQEPSLDVSMYMGDTRFLETFGLRLVQGRGFNADEVQWLSPDAKIQSAILSSATARRLFPGRSPLGETIYFGDPQPVRVVGVVEHLIRPSFRVAETDQLAHTVIVPVRTPYTAGAYYVLRTMGSDRDRVMAEARTRLQASNPSIAFVGQGNLEAQRDKFFRQERAIAWLLSAICLALLMVTALGIYGLSSFWIAQRTHQIGVRRALGATRGQILAQLLAENGALVVTGVVLGVPLAMAINGYLVTAHDLPRLPSSFLLVGSLALLALGQLSVLVPARHAASITPAEATRAR